MGNPKFYYRFMPIGVDYTSEKNIKRHSEELNQYSDLANQFGKLKTAFDTASKERADITLNILPDISGVTELHVHHSIKYKLFSREIKKQCFFLCMTNTDKDALFEYETIDIKEVESIFNELITNHSIPNLSNWKRIL